MASYESVLLNCTVKEAQQNRLARRKNDARIDAYNLDFQKLLDKPSAVYDFLINTELKLFPNWDYLVGSAADNDELLVLRGISGALLTAEHASYHRRIRKKQWPYIRNDKEYEQGTGALSCLVGQETKSDAIVAIGRQTGDANSDISHPFKRVIEKVITRPFSQSKGILTLHGMIEGHTLDPKSTRGRSIQLGIGNHPSDATRTLTHDYLKTNGEDLDLIVGINDPHLRFKKGRPVLSPDGKSIQTRTFKGAGNTVRNFAETKAKEYGKYDSFAAVQVELSSVLRIPSPEIDVFPTQRERELGAYLGYLFVRSAVESVELL